MRLGGWEAWRLEGWETLARRLIAHREQASSSEPGEVKSKKLKREEAEMWVGRA